MFAHGDNLAGKEAHKTKYRDEKSRQYLRQIRKKYDVPLVTIECKTYLDKTMLQDASSSAGVVKLRSPNGLCIVVAEWLKLTEAVNLHKFNLDQIFVLRKQKNTDREFRYSPGYVKNPIYADAVSELFSLVRTHLTVDWSSGIKGGLKRGFLI